MKSNEGHETLGVILIATQVMFIINRVAGVAPFATWNWWLVLSPLLTQLGLVALLLTVVRIEGWRNDRHNRRRRRRNDSGEWWDSP